MIARREFRAPLCCKALSICKLRRSKTPGTVWVPDLWIFHEHSRLIRVPLYMLTCVCVWLENLAKGSWATLRPSRQPPGHCSFRICLLWEPASSQECHHHAKAYLNCSQRLTKVNQKKQAKMRRDHGTNMLISNPSSSSCKCQERVVQLSRLDRRSRSHKPEMQQPTLPQMASRWATIFLLLALKHGT